MEIEQTPTPTQPAVRNVEENLHMQINAENLHIMENHACSNNSFNGEADFSRK